MDNLQIIRDRIVENTKVNPNKYGLVKQMGPFDMTPGDIYNAGLPPRRPRREEFLEPDAVPRGVNDDLMWMPVLLGGGFSLENGSVVQESVYDARITAPGQKVRGVPMEGPGVLKALQSSIARSNQTVMPSMPGQTTPSNPATPAAPAPSAPAKASLEAQLQNWDKLTDREKETLIRQAGGNEKYFVAVIPKMTQDEKDTFMRITKAYFDRVNNVPPACRRDSGCTKEDREAEKAANDQFLEVLKIALGAVFELLF